MWISHDFANAAKKTRVWRLTFHMHLLDQSKFSVLHQPLSCLSSRNLLKCAWLIMSIRRRSGGVASSQITVLGTGSGNSTSFCMQACRYASAVIKRQLGNGGLFSWKIQRWGHYCNAQRTSLKHHMQCFLPHPSPGHNLSIFSQLRDVWILFKHESIIDLDQK